MTDGPFCKTETCDREIDPRQVLKNDGYCYKCKPRPATKTDKVGFKVDLGIVQEVLDIKRPQEIEMQIARHLEPFVAEIIPWQGSTEYAIAFALDRAGRPQKSLKKMWEIKVEPYGSQSAYVDPSPFARDMSEAQLLLSHIYSLPFSLKRRFSAIFNTLLKIKASPGIERIKEGDQQILNAITLQYPDTLLEHLEPILIATAFLIWIKHNQRKPLNTEEKRLDQDLAQARKDAKNDEV